VEPEEQEAPTEVLVPPPGEGEPEASPAEVSEE
jgi:hypothetical protein